MPVYASPEARTAAINNARAYVASLPPFESIYLNELVQSESGWSPDAESGTGARGLGQFTKGTWNDTVKWIRDNPGRIDLPAGLTADQLADYDNTWDRPLANAVLSYANIQRLEDQVLPEINRGRLRAGQPDASSLLEAVGGDVRRWATVVATGHKDGGSRQRLWFNDQGTFDPDRAIAFYQPRAEQARAEADSLTSQAQAAEAAGNQGAADRLFRNARALRNSDANGHVFGYADRLSGAVGDFAGLPPLEFTREQTQQMSDLRIPGATDDNPSVVRFTERLNTGVGIAEPQVDDAGTQASAATPRTFDPVGAAFNAAIPAADAAGVPVANGVGDRPGLPTPPTGSVARDAGVATREAVQGLGERAREFGAGVRDLAADGIGALGGVLSGLTDVPGAIADGVARDVLDPLRRANRDQNIEQLQDPNAVSGFLQGLRGIDTEAQLQALVSERVQEQEAIDALGTPTAGQLSPAERLALQESIDAAGAPALAEPGTFSEGLQVSDLLGVDNLQPGLFDGLQRAQLINSLDNDAAARNAEVDRRLAQQDLLNTSLALLRNQPEINLGTSEAAIAGITANELGQTGLASDLNFTRPTFPTTGNLSVDLPSGDDFARSFNALSNIGDPTRRAGVQAGLLQELAATDPVEALRLQGQSQLGLDPFRDFNTNLAVAQELLSSSANQNSQDQALSILDQANSTENAGLLPDNAAGVIQNRLRQLIGSRLGSSLEARQRDFRFGF